MRERKFQFTFGFLREKSRDRGDGRKREAKIIQKMEISLVLGGQQLPPTGCKPDFDTKSGGFRGDLECSMRMSSNSIP